LLKQAEFNWIWFTWSSGWSFKDEQENRENLKHVIARCHANGIHVTAYLSASNMFRKSAYRDDPETKKYVLWMHGIPMFYAGPTKTDLQISWDRRLANTRKPGWRAYLLKKAELAVDAGVDAIMWDNMIGYNDGLAQLLEDTQRMTERKAGESGRPKVMVSANIHISPDRFGMNDINEVIWEEAQEIFDDLVIKLRIVLFLRAPQYERMMEWLAKTYVNALNIIHYMHDKYCYESIEMALHDRDIVRTMGFGIEGLSHAADSLSAIKSAKVKPIRDDTGLIVDFTVEGDFPQLRQQR
jgi:pyruvate formate lyase-like protein/glycosyl hydrolase family 114